jgi:putative spermidine/putrescine transport system permease protein
MSGIVASRSHAVKTVRSDRKGAPDPWLRRSRRRWALLLIPVFAVLLAVFILPMINLGLKSLHPYMGPGSEGTALTLSNYIAFLSRAFYWQLLGWTALLGLIVVACSLVLALPLSYFLARTRSRWKQLFLLVVIAPMLVSVVIRNLGWLPILGQNGIVNWIWLTTGLGTEPLHLVDNYIGVVIGLIHALLPFMILTLISVIQRIPPELEEASISLGVKPVGTFWRVVLPLALPGIIAGSLLVFTLTISAYTTPMVMGGGRVIVVSTYIQQQVSTLLNYPNGATVSMVLLALVVILSITSLRLGKTKA